jgi:hypothetical protein
MSAKEAIETGTTWSLEKKNYDDALQLQQKAMGMSLNADEARAAMYANSACMQKQHGGSGSDDAIQTGFANKGN